jgi:hypothetical protein
MMNDTEKLDPHLARAEAEGVTREVARARNFTEMYGATRVGTENRPWARLSSLRAGSVVELDEGFTCHPAGEVTLLQDDRTGELYFECTCGRHLISGQADDGEHCVGVYARKE